MDKARDGLIRLDAPPDERVDDAVSPAYLRRMLACLEAGAANADAPLETLSALGHCYHALGMHEQAILAWRRASSREDRPEQRAALHQQLADALTDWGTALKIAGEKTEPRPERVRGTYLEAVLEKYREALRLDPAHALASYNIGVVHAQIGRLRTAKNAFRRALKSDPAMINARVSLGMVLKQLDDPEAAARCFERALKRHPASEVAVRCLVETLNDLGARAKARGELREAIAHYRRALSHDAKIPLVWYNLGVAHTAAGRPRRARTCYEIALVLNPDFAEAYSNLGARASAAGDHDRALACFEKATSISPDHVETLNNMGGIYTLQGRLDEARASLERALAIDPGYVAAWNNLSIVAHDDGDMNEAERCYENALGHAPGAREMHHNRLMTQNYYADSMPPGKIYADHAAWGRRFEELHPPMPADPTRSLDPERPLRIGYLSPDFTGHSVGYFMQGVLAHHSPAVRSFCYANMAKGDAKTRVFKDAAHAWRPVHGMSAEAVAALIREDRIDLLVDLTGHTANNRLDVMALRPAPLQLTYLGYPNTTGLSSIDYRLTDALADPHDTAQRYTERLLRLPGCFLAYTPPGDLPDVALPPSAPARPVTFVSFNNSIKLNERVLLVWARILAALPGSRLLLKNKLTSSPGGRARLRARLAQAGVSADRVDCAPLQASTRAHLALYNQGDLSLDTFPYAGTTTTCEALIMGVPVVTLRGPSHAHNVGRSLLAAAGLAELVAHTEDEYVALACRLASDRDRLAELRRTLRGRVLASPLCDARAFTRRLEEAYRSVWREHCSARRPEIELLAS